MDFELRCSFPYLSFLRMQLQKHHCGVVLYFKSLIRQKLQFSMRMAQNEPSCAIALVALANHQHKKEDIISALNSQQRIQTAIRFHNTSGQLKTIAELTRDLVECCDSTDWIFKICTRNLQSFDGRVRLNYCLEYKTTVLLGNCSILDELVDIGVYLCVRDEHDDDMSIVLHCYLVRDFFIESAKRSGGRRLALYLQTGPVRGNLFTPQRETRTIRISRLAPNVYRMDAPVCRPFETLIEAVVSMERDDVDEEENMAEATGS